MVLIILWMVPTISVYVYLCRTWGGRMTLVEHSGLMVFVLLLPVIVMVVTGLVLFDMIVGGGARGR